MATSHGRVVMRVEVRQQMPDGLVRVPHGWWMPESPRGGDHLSGVWTFGDAQLTGDDDPELMDIEQGIPHLRGVPCRVSKLNADELKTSKRPMADERAAPRTEARDRALRSQGTGRLHVRPGHRRRRRVPGTGTRNLRQRFTELTR